MLFAISDPLGLAVVGVINALVIGSFGVLMFWLKEKADREREEREFARHLIADKKLDGIANVGQKSHDLANSAMLSQKRLLAKVTKAHADSTGRPEDRAVADAAEMAYQEHLAGQTVSDAKELAAAKVVAAAKIAEQKQDDPPQSAH